MKNHTIVEISNGRGWDELALFSFGSEALRCLPAMGRIYGRPIRLRTEAGELPDINGEPLPRGVVQDYHDVPAKDVDDDPKMVGVFVFKA